MESFQWRSHACSIIQETARFYRFGVYVDCCLLVEGKRIQAHKLMLAAASAYFQVLFMTRTGELPIRLDNVKYDDAKSILDFIYEGVVDIPVTRVASFMKTAEDLQIRALVGYLHKNVWCKRRYGDGTRKEMSNMPLDVLRDRRNRHFRTKDTLPQGNSILHEDNGVELPVEIKLEVLDTDVDDPEDPTFESCEDFHRGYLNRCQRRSGGNFEKDIDQQSTVSFKSEDWLALKKDYRRRYCHRKMLNESCGDGGSSLSKLVRRSVGAEINHRSASKENEDNFPTNRTLELSEKEVSGGTNTNGPSTQQTKVVSNSTSSPVRVEPGSGKSGIPNSDVNDTHGMIANTDLPDDTDSHNLEEVDVVFERFTIGTKHSVQLVCAREPSRLRKSSGSRDPNREPNRLREPRKSCTRDEGSKKFGPSDPSRPTDLSRAKDPHRPKDRSHLADPHRLKESNLPTDPRRPEDTSHPSEPVIESATPPAEVAGTSKKTVTFHSSEKEKKKKGKRAAPMEKTGTGDRPYKCPHCPSAFKRSTHCKDHIDTHTGSRPYKCNLCPKTYTQRANLMVHERRHTGEKPYVCPHCQRAFTMNCALQAHILLHTGEKPYECNFCPMRFRQESTRKRHIRKHTKEKPFGCNECKTFFSFKSALVIHLRTHTGEKPFECAVCGKSFASRSGLSVHMRKHTGERPYKCNVCNKAFTQTISLYRHLESMEHKRNQVKEAT